MSFEFASSPYLVAVKLFPELERKNGRFVVNGDFRDELVRRKDFAHGLYVQIKKYCEESGLPDSVSYAATFGAPSQISNPTVFPPAQLRPANGHHDSMPAPYSPVSIAFRNEVLAYEKAVAYANIFSWRVGNLPEWLLLRCIKGPRAKIYGILGSAGDVQALERLVSEFAQANREPANGYLITLSRAAAFAGRP